MKITVKGQVTIPKLIREHHGLYPGSEVRFVEKDRSVILEKAQKGDVWARYYGYLKMRKRTDALIRLLRGPRP
ncbi:MAG: AbrB/MazE/SpoVT family DNA-binding domain-containing protein [Candidatus Omnitrophica bacterium]|nr:AbrB/MazE/SpoVT family DNA-binding domain-containing protein [Candidatus Omnitrophota bacterium]